MPTHQPLKEALQAVMSPCDCQRVREALAQAVDRLAQCTYRDGPTLDKARALMAEYHCDHCRDTGWTLTREGMELVSILARYMAPAIIRLAKQDKDLPEF